jgi:hypothetical protein
MNNSEKPRPRLLGPRNRLTVIGRTGSGKTTGILWHLSKQNLRDGIPWLLIDFKGDELIADIRNAHIADFDTVPKEKGLHILRPRLDETEELNKLLWKIWEEENIGVILDEGYMMSESRAYDALLTQGRTKNIPVITGTQRPVKVSRFVFSEATFIQVYDLNDARDYDIVREFVPDSPSSAPLFSRPLQDYYSWYIDTERKQVFMFKPMPDKAIILATINQQLHTRKI